MTQRVAIVGSGPSGFYAVQALFKADPDVRCDLLERLPTPYGLVRGGVAPDHQKIKSVVRAYEKTATEERFRWFGNVELGRDVTIDELLERYDRVVLAVGAQSASRLGIPGENLRGSYTATEFVAWYNAHPDYQDRTFPLDADDAVVVGVGNVAMDVARILAAPRSHLAPTDITDTALASLDRDRRVRVHVLGRRGPAQAAFTPKEIQEISAIEGIDVRTVKKEVKLDPLSEAWLDAEGTRANRDNVDFVQSRTGMRLRTARAEMWLRFCVSPVALLGDDRVEAVKVEHNRIVERDGRLSCEGTGVFEEIPAGIVLAAVGYRSVPIPGVPFDVRRGLIPNEAGQVVDGDVPVEDLFVVGWAKRGPSGLIGTNRLDSTATVTTMMRTPVMNPAQGPDPEAWLRERVPQLVTWAEWEQLDAHETQRGTEKGKVRDKFASVTEMLAHLKDQR
ncbi:MAG: FAD-dependent oxidoreductase [Myxococcota bacterium]